MTVLSISTIDFESQSSGSKEINFPFDLDVKNKGSIAYVVRWQLAKRRSGSAKTKTMAEISGTTAKPWKQKGTGRARQGSRRSVQFVGGRTCHGPMPRSFDFSIPKQVAQKGLLDALRLKLKEKRVVLFSVNDINTSAKTSKIQSTLKKNNIGSALIVSEDNQNLIKSVRNLQNAKFLNSSAINVYDIVSHDYLIIDSKAFEGEIFNKL